MRFLRHSIPWLAACCALAAPAADPRLPQVQATLTQVPLHFEANQGQWNAEVRFAARTATESIYLTAQGPVLAAQGRRVDISLVHANRSPVIEPLDQLPGKVDYYIGNRASWRAGVTQFSRVAFRAVLPGIDIVYYG